MGGPHTPQAIPKLPKNPNQGGTFSSSTQTQPAPCRRDLGSPHVKMPGPWAHQLPLQPHNTTLRPTWPSPPSARHLRVAGGSSADGSAATALPAVDAVPNWSTGGWPLVLLYRPQDWQSLPQLAITFYWQCLPLLSTVVPVLLSDIGVAQAWLAHDTVAATASSCCCCAHRCQLLLLLHGPQSLPCSCFCCPDMTLV
jgi:hypothetical protein